MAGAKSKSTSSANPAEPKEASTPIESTESVEPVAPTPSDNKSVNANGSASQPANSSTPAESGTPANAVTTPQPVGKTVPPDYGNYDDYQLLPDAPWPPPVFVRQNISPQERYYIEHRWYSQWSFFDKKATENKSRYFRTQLIVGLGSVTVPVLVGINIQGQFEDALYIITVVISLAVAMSTAIESLYTFGDNWRTYRTAAEELKQEKSIYDVKAGRYQNHPQSFLRFVERCEEIIAQQNGRWIQSQEKSADQGDSRDDEVYESMSISTVDSFGSPLPSSDTEYSTSEPDASMTSAG